MSNTSAVSQRINATLADTINASTAQVVAAVELLDDGATVPFVARYRKEKTGGLDDNQLRTLEERLLYLRELEARRDSIRQSINEQGQLNTALAQRLDAATTKSELEDLYLPYRRKRKTKGVTAIEAGLEPLADQLWDHPSSDPETTAANYINPESGIADTAAALEGARYILLERFAEDAQLIAGLRDLLSRQGIVVSKLVKGKAEEGKKFNDYFEFQERYKNIPSHRALAMFRGRAEGILSLSIQLPSADGTASVAECIERIARHTGFQDRGQPADAWRKQVVEWTWKIKLKTHLETDLFVALRERADTEAIKVFTHNLRDLLLAPPAGSLTTLGLDPGFRSGVKVAVTDATGKVLDHTTIYPHAPQKQWKSALATLLSLCEKFSVRLIAIGNGTASRETDRLAAAVIDEIPQNKPKRVTVSEAGASVYSASKLAEQEFPRLDVTIRGAISIARRLQDPLSELVKIDPKAIGVGQYQHDVAQTALARSLDATVEDCVNQVGVDLNTASSALLTRVAGINSTIADNIVKHRDEQGPFATRTDLKKVSRLGPKAFEQCAGFLRISDGKNPLDASGVHPEAYPVAKRIVETSGVSLKQLIGDSGRLKALNPADFTDDQFGLPTVQDILTELEKPGRDPRPEFRTAEFTDVEKLEDLQPNQILEGQVTNVTNFGAFVDVGVHQDGLVHIASMSDRFIKDPREIVRTGDVVKVKVMSVDIERKRISLSMRLTDDANDADSGKRGGAATHRQRQATHAKPAQQRSNQRRSNRKHKNSRPDSSGKPPSALAQALQDSLGKPSK
ncbi:MAG: RNA-binding transcriptional accessory protein [Gammaproteobacteria bacterium]|nr:RNA-binding transcriptional accessory protein [Gammaproteobacteria bacterium]